MPPTAPPTDAVPGTVRPRIRPGLRQVWRDAATVQIGLTPDAGVIVTGLLPGEGGLLDQLDGTRRLPELAAWAAAHGLDPARVPRLLSLLAGAGVLAGPPTDRAHLHRLGAEQRRRLGPDALAWSAVYPDAGDGFELLATRAREPVLVVGEGRLAAVVQARLAGAGLTVSTGPRPGPPTGPRPGLRDGRVGRPAYRLVVLVGEEAVAATALADRLGEQLAEQPAHLAVVAGADRAAVGPLVVAGRSACLRCVELHRTDRDPAWPTVAAQLAGAGRDGAGESSLVELAAALTALQVACWVDGRRTPASVGATLSIRLPDGLTSRHPWTRHPRCGCAWLAPSLPGAGGVDGSDRGDARSD